MFRNHKVIFVLWLFLISILTVFSAEPRRVVRVGFGALPGFHEQNENGERSGYGYEYLQYIASRANWDLEYIGYEKSWAELQAMLERGEVDLLSCVNKTPEREKIFAFPDKPIGTSFANLTVLPHNNKYSPWDYSTWNGMRIGFVTANRENDFLFQFVKKRNIVITPFYFSTDEACREALHSGKVDAMLSINFRKMDYECILARFSPDPIYFAVKKNNTTLLHELNLALARVSYDKPMLNSELEQRYYGYENISFLGIKEQEFINTCKQNKRVFRAMISACRAPFSYLKDGKLQGWQYDLVKKILAHTELSFELIPYYSREDYLQKLNSGNFDLILDANHSLSQAEHANLYLSETYITTPISILSKKNKTEHTGKSALLLDTPLSGIPPVTTPQNSEVIYFYSIPDIVNAVKRGDVDNAYMYTRSCNEIVRFDPSGQLTSTLYYGLKNSFSMAVKRESPPEFLAILNHAISTLNSNKVNDSVLNYSSSDIHEHSLGEWFSAHPWQGMSGVLCLLGVAIAFLFYLLMSKRLSYQKAKIIEKLPLRFFVFDQDGHILYLCSGDHKWIGYDKSVQNINQLPNTDVNTKILEHGKTVFATGNSDSFDYNEEEIARSGRLIPLPPTLFGKPTVLWISMDTTKLQAEKRRVEEYAVKLENTTQLWDILINFLPIHIFAKDADNQFRYLFNNQSRAKFFGTTVNDLNGKTDFDFLPLAIAKEMRSSDEQNMQNLCTTRTDFKDLYDSNGMLHHEKIIQLPFVRKDGHRILIGTAFDVTELVETQRQAEELAQQLALTLQSIGDAVITTDETGNITYLNPIAEKMCAIPNSDAKGRPHADIFHIVNYETGKQVESPVDRTLKTGKPVELANHTDLIAQDGARYHIADSSSPIIGPDGKIIGVILVFRDVTAEYERRDRIYQSNACFELAAEMTNAASFITDTKTRKTVGSKRLHELWPQDENGCGLSFDDWVYSEDIPKCKDVMAKMVSGEISEITLTYRAQKYGNLRYFRIKAQRDQSDFHSSRLLGIIQDITEIRHDAVKLQETLQLWNNVLDLSPNLLFVKSASEAKKYLFANQAFTNFARCSLQEVIGHTGHEILSCNENLKKNASQKLQEVIKSTDEQAVNKGTPMVYRQRLIDYDGNEKFFQVNKKAFKNSSGKPLILGIATDITELEYERENKRILNECLQTYFNNESFSETADSLIKITGEYLKSASAFIIKLNTEKTQADIIAEYTAANNLAIFDEFHHFVFNSTDPWYLSLLNHELVNIKNIDSSKSIHFFGRMEDQFASYASTIGTGIYLHGKLWGVLGIFYTKNTKDLGHWKLDTLLSVSHILTLLLYKELDRKVILDALAQAKNAEKAKSFFLATMSHEIRTPLNAVIGFSELLKEGNLSVDEQVDYIKNIYSSGNILLQLINDVLDLSKLEAEQMNLVEEAISIEKIIKEVAVAFSYRIQQDHNRLIQEVPAIPILKLDPLRLRQILLNLIGNAVKFTKDGTIKVGATFERTTPEKGILRLCVEDTGIGIAEEDQKKLMEPFVQLSRIRGTNAHNNGTGLGLAICKRLAKRMNGTIQLESALGKGSRFIVTLPEIPIVKSPFDNGNGTSVSVHENAKLSLLIVDDVKMNLLVMKAMCQKCGITDIVCVLSGNEALAQLEKRAFDMVLTDMWMPGMNGCELASKIRAIERFSRVPIIAITADIEANGNFDLKEFSGVLLKPVTIEKITKIREFALNSSSDRTRL